MVFSVADRLSLQLAFAYSAFVIQALPTQNDVVLRTVDNIVHRQQTHVRTGFYIYFNLTFVAVGTTLLGGNQHNTVRTTATIERSSSSILQNSSACDIARVDRTNRTCVQWNTIYYVERAAVGRDRTDTADTD